MHIPTIERRGEAAMSAPASPTVDVAAPQTERLVPVFAPLVGHVLKGTFFSVITLGVYRFWYRTALRRYYWRNTTLAGDGFEYTGTGKELFVGFLIAIAIVLPIYLGVTLLGLMGGQAVGPVIASVLGALVMPAVVQILSYRARRYRLVRTRFRGVRFHQSGSGMGYLLHTVKWLILTALTLGILLPHFRRALARYKTENTWYGSAQGRFSAPAAPLMRAWLAVWFCGLVIAGIALVMGVFGAAGAYLGPELLGLMIGGSVLIGVLLLILPLLWQRYRVAEFRAFVSGTSFGDIQLDSDLGLGAVLWVWARYGLILIGIGVAGFTASAMLGIEPEMGTEATLRRAPVILLIGFCTVIAWVLATEILFRRKLWSLRAASITVTNLAALDAIVQTAGQEASGVGEAFDTGFDVAG